MDWLEFVATMTAALAWPVVALIVIVLFRDKIKYLLGRPAKRWKVGPVEAEWDETVGEASVELANAPEAEMTPPQTDDRRTKELLDLASKSPRAAVLEAAIELEAALRDYLQANGVLEDGGLKISIGSMARLARKAGLLSVEAADVIGRLAVLRNLAVHAVEPISYEQAVDFVSLSGGVLQLLDAKTPVPS